MWRCIDKGQNLTVQGNYDAKYFSQQLSFSVEKQGTFKETPYRSVEEMMGNLMYLQLVVLEHIFDAEEFDELAVQRVARTMQFPITLDSTNIIFQEIQIADITLEDSWLGAFAAEDRTGFRFN